MQNFYSNGKLLLTGEYVVLDGALSLAVPTKFGQSLKITQIDKPIVKWTSLDEFGNIWFENKINLNNIDFRQAKNNNEVYLRLWQILLAAKNLNSNFLNTNKGFEVKTKLDFQRNWGLGTSSTLINNIANWANVDPFKLLEQTFGGSGYDIACAQIDSPITYQLNNNSRIINTVNFNPSFLDNIFFIHLNKKQDSRKGIENYKFHKGDISSSVELVTKLTTKMLNCKCLNTFEALITEHEYTISEVIKIKPIKEDLFKDYKGSIKSLGAWGGDFILVTGGKEDMSYFKKRGYNTILSYKEMVL